MKKLLFPPPVATRTVYTIWKQIVNLIPPQIVFEAAIETKILSRSFTPWSHLLALIYQQLTKTESLNGVCDAADAFKSEWCRMRGAQVPHRNTFANANRMRDPKMAELVFWRVFVHLKAISPGFANAETFVPQHGVGRGVVYAFCEMHNKCTKCTMDILRNKSQKRKTARKTGGGAATQHANAGVNTTQESSQETTEKTTLQTTLQTTMQPPISSMLGLWVMLTSSCLAVGPARRDR